MRIVSQRRGFSLCPDDIDSFSEWLEEVAGEAGLEARDALRARLFAEEILLGMRDHFGAEAKATVMFESRLGRPHLRIEVPGDAYNPLVGQDAPLGAWGALMGASMGIPTQYAYVGGANVIRMTVPTRQMNPVLRLALFVVAGILIGVVGSRLLPDATAIALSDMILKPVYDMWTRLLNAISGPIVFLTVVTTMLSMRDVDAKGGDSKRVVVRYFVLSIVAVAAAALFVGTLHPLELGEMRVDTDLGQTMVANILSVVPGNIFDPFVESNTTQLLFLAFVLGYLLMRLGDGTATIRQGILEANSMGLTTAAWASRLVPVFVAVFLCLEIMTGQTSVLIDIWRPLLLSLGISVAAMLIVLVATAMRMRVSPLLMARKVWEPFAVALRTGSLDQAFDDVMASNTGMLGIDRSYSQEAVPQGLVLYMPVSAIGTIAFTIYVAQVFSVPSTPLWFASAIVMAVVVFVATPPVPGANLLAYVVLFATLGIPSEALIDAMIFDVLFGIFAGAANQTMLQLEMVLQASHFGLLDRERLATSPK